MAFLARLVSRPRRRHRHVHATSIPPRSVQPAVGRSPQHLRSTTFLAALPGGSGWGRLVVPPSSRSRTLRRNGRRTARGMTGYRLRRKMSPRMTVRRPKTVKAVTFAMRETATPPHHAANEAVHLDGGLSRSLRAGTSRRARRAGPGRDFPGGRAAGRSDAAPHAPRQALAVHRS
jgi:hypothetical protein